MFDLRHFMFCLIFMFIRRVGIKSGDVRTPTFYVLSNIYVYHDVLVLSSGMFDSRYFMFFIMCGYESGDFQSPTILGFICVLFNMYDVFFERSHGSKLDNYKSNQ